MTGEGGTRHRRYLCIAYHSRVDWPSSNRRFDFHRTSLPAKFNCVWLLCDGRTTTPRKKKEKRKKGETTVESAMSLLHKKNPRPVLGSSCINNNISVMAANISLSPRLASIYIFLPHKQFNCRTTTTTDRPSDRREIHSCPYFYESRRRPAQYGDTIQSNSLYCH